MPVKPNLDYEKTVAGFRWEEVYQELDWMPDGSLNAAHEAIDRHALGPLGDKTAMIWLGKEGEREEYTFRLMRALSSRFANVLKSLGVEKGDRICICLDRVPELTVVMIRYLELWSCDYLLEVLLTARAKAGRDAGPLRVGRHHQRGLRSADLAGIADQGAAVRFDRRPRSAGTVLRFGDQ